MAPTAPCIGSVRLGRAPWRRSPEDVPLETATVRPAGRGSVMIKEFAHATDGAGVPRLLDGDHVGGIELLRSRSASLGPGSTGTC